MVFFFFFSFPPKHSRCKRNYKNMHVSHLCEREQRWFVFVFIKIVNCWIVISFNSNAIYFSKYNLIASRIFRSFKFFFPSWYHYVTYFSHLLYLPSYYLDPWKNQPKKKKSSFMLVLSAYLFCLLSSLLAISVIFCTCPLIIGSLGRTNPKKKKKKKKIIFHPCSLSLSLYLFCLLSSLSEREGNKHEISLQFFNCKPITCNNISIFQFLTNILQGRLSLSLSVKIFFILLLLAIWC